MKQTILDVACALLVALALFLLGLSYFDILAR